MERSTGVTDEVVGRECEPLPHQDWQMIEVEEYTNQPQNPEASQCSSTGCT